MKGRANTRAACVERIGSVTKTETGGRTRISESPLSQIRRLQQTLGNQAVLGLFKSGVIQARLKIGEPNDIYEREADRVADHVTRMPDKTVASDQLSVAGKENNGSIRMKPG